MKSVHVKNLPKFNYGIEFSILEQTESGVFKPLLPFSSCRSFMCDTLFSIKNKKYKVKPSYNFHLDYKKGSIYVALSAPVERIKQFIDSIHSLHEIEKKAKVRRSVVYKTQLPNCIIIKGSSHWKQSCWKMMLYTFYLKTFCYTKPKEVDTNYWEALSRGNEEILLSKIKIKREIFSSKVYVKQSMGRHDLEGFVSICRGRNPPMTKLLGVKTV